MKKTVNVSIIMAEYNTPLSKLKESINSILSQTFKDFELILIDDGGVRNVSTIVRNFNDPRIKVVKNDTNLGLVDSLNKAIEHASGQYLVRMDTDDIALPTRIERQYDFMTSHPEYAVVGSRAIEFSEIGDEGILGMPGEKTMKSVMRGDVLIHPSVMMRKDAVQSAGMYQKYKRAEDLSLWCELLLAGYRLYVVDEILLKYRVNTDDYDKRKLKNRTGEIKVRLHYYPKMKAGLFEYLYVIKTVVAGIVPGKLVKKYRSKFVLKRGERG